ncbi:MAG: PadR family transcriptional regulator [Chitinophagaceae bacterium]|nr:MAG: PadR family transcriptional regulator [Chitinophagaceae bacterium]
MHKILMYTCLMKQNYAFIKGSLNTILLKLLRENGRMYGYEITKMVRELSEGTMQLTEGALYPALHKLEADGLVVTTLEEVGNRKRKYYSLTPSGKKESGRKLKELAAFIEQMENILKLKLAQR